MAAHCKLRGHFWRGGVQSFKKISEETRDRTNLKRKDDLIPRFETPTVVEGGGKGSMETILAAGMLR